MRRLRFRVLLAACVGAALVAGQATPVAAQATASGAERGCPAAPARNEAPHRLPGTARALGSSNPLTVIAVGSALEGAHVGERNSLPARTLDRLRAAMPAARIDLRVRNSPGATAADMVATLGRELRGEQGSRSVRLVLWQTGTVDAAKRTDPAAFGRALAQGIRQAADAGADVMLIDPLFSRLLETRADVRPYEDQLVRAGGLPGADLFRRHALMRAWVESGAIDLESVPRGDRARTLARLHDCLAAALAAQIVADAGANEQSAGQD